MTGPTTGFGVCAPAGDASTIVGTEIEATAPAATAVASLLVKPIVRVPPT